MEILTWIKFFPQPLLEASSPDDVKLPWLATLSLFSLWGLLFVAVSEDSSNDSLSSNSSSFCNANKGGGKVGEASCPLASLDDCSVVSANSAREKDSNGSTSGVTASDAVADANAPPRRDRR